MYLEEKIKSLCIGETGRLPYQEGLQVYRRAKNEYIVIAINRPKGVKCNTIESAIEEIEDLLAEQI